MAAVSKIVDWTASIDNNQGEVTLNNEIPNGWTDYLGATATMTTADGWVASVRKPDADDQLVIRCLRRNGAQVEPIPQDTQVRFTLVLHGQG